MKLVSKLSLILALAGASTVYADTAPAKAPAKAPAPADKKAPPPAAAPAEPKKPMATPEEIKKVEAFFDDFVGAIVKNADACPKMGPAVNAVIDKHEAFLKKMAETDKDVPQATKDKMASKQNDIMNAIMKCKDDKGVVAAFDRFTKISAGAKKPAATK